MLPLDFDHCTEVPGYQPTLGCPVGVDDAALLAEVSMLWVVDDDALVVGGDVSVIIIGEEHLRALSGRCGLAAAQRQSKQTPLLVPVTRQVLGQLCETAPAIMRSDETSPLSSCSSH